MIAREVLVRLAIAISAAALIAVAWIAIVTACSGALPCGLIVLASIACWTFSRALVRWVEHGGSVQ